MLWNKRYLPDDLRLPGGVKIARSHYLAYGIYYAEDKDGNGYLLITIIRSFDMTPIGRMQGKKAPSIYMCFEAKDFPLLLIELRDALWYMWRASAEYCAYLAVTYRLPPGYMEQPEATNARDIFANYGRYTGLNCACELCSANSRGRCAKICANLDDHGRCADFSLRQQ